MSQRQHKTLRRIEALTNEAHCAVHLLLELGAAITEPAVAAECNEQAALLGRAVRSMNERRTADNNGSPAILGDAASRRDIPRETRLSR